MGARYFCCTADGTDAAEVFNSLRADAEEEYGRDSYNGTISTTSLRIVHHNNKPYTKTYENKMRKKCDGSEDTPKWSCDCEDLGIIGYEVKKLVHKRVPQSKGTYKTVYNICCDEDVYLGRAHVKQNFASKKEAEDYLKKHFSEIRGAAEIVESKIWDASYDGRKTVSAYNVETKMYKKRPVKAAAGSIVKPIHRYLFHGWAAE